MSEFEDPQLERLLGGAGGAFPDVNTAYAQVQGRVRHIKRRRAMVAGTAACVLIAAGAAFAVGRTGSPDRLQPGDHGSLGSDSTTVDDTTGVTDAITPLTTVGGGTPGQSGNGQGGTSGQGGDSGQGGNGQGTGSSTTAATTSAPSTTANGSASGPQTYSSLGNSIVVEVVGGQLVLVGTDHPAPGFTLDSKTVRATRIEFRWRSTTQDTTIRIDLINGVAVRKV